MEALAAAPAVYTVSQAGLGIVDRYDLETDIDGRVIAICASAMREKRSSSCRRTITASSAGIFRIFVIFDDVHFCRCNRQAIFAIPINSISICVRDRDFPWSSAARLISVWDQRPGIVLGLVFFAAG